MKIIHLKQRHREIVNFTKNQVKSINSEYCERTAESQFLVAQEILKYPEAPIVFEGIHENLLLSSFCHKLCVEAKQIFPGGMPSNFHMLNPQQKKFLYWQSGPYTLLFLDLISGLYKSIREKTYIFIDNKLKNSPIQPDFYKFIVYDLREREAMFCIKELISQYHCQTIILVFGAAHDFEPYCIEEGIMHEAVNCISLLDKEVLTKVIAEVKSFAIPWRHHYYQAIRQRELEETFEAGQLLRDYVAMGFLKENTLSILYKKKPWLLEALRNPYVRTAIYMRVIIIRELSLLTEDECKSATALAAFPYKMQAKVISYLQARYGQ
jgi:hypothetical protein